MSCLLACAHDHQFRIVRRMNFNPVAEVARILRLASENSGRSPLQTLTDTFTGDFGEFPL